MTWDAINKKDDIEGARGIWKSMTGKPRVIVRGIVGMTRGLSGKSTPLEAEAERNILA